MNIKIKHQYLLKDKISKKVEKFLISAYNELYKLNYMCVSYIVAERFFKKEDIIIYATLNNKVIEIIEINYNDYIGLAYIKKEYKN